ncbi:helix-turn-helix domain-containing protein [Pedobacter heparinus]|uniref:helix-turn-helix domain-containing protein n=1 Tax=Pedobacter heparinus TaxID=984 RepID=UPI002930B105|nr:helix-turn-helix domain-containing protein [Pedobacter heparinus]
MFALNICLALNLIILFVAFFFRNNNTLPNRILALILLDTAISFLGNASIVGGYFTAFPYLFFLSWCTSSYFGPLFFTYTCLLTGSHLKLKHPIWISGFLVSAFGLSFPLNYFLLPVIERPGFVASLLAEPLPWQMTVINIVGMLTILISVFAAARKIVQYKKRLISTLSNLEKTKLIFITQFVILGFILTTTTIVLYLVLPQYLVEYLYLPCLITCIYFFILFYTFRHHAIFTPETYGQFLKDTLPASEEMRIDEIKLSSVPRSELQLLAERIETYLIESGIYTNPDLTLGILAKGMNLSSDKISVAINKQMNKTFFDLVNEKRVEKAKELLAGKINILTIEAIAAEAGFNSRASFYRAFKKCTALTPSEYLNKSEPVFLAAK